MPLPCRHFRPASMTSHFEESTMNGTLATSGSLREQREEARHRRDAVDHPLVHADVDDVGAVLDLLARDADGLFVLALLDELGELGRAGDVGALADHDVDARLLGERLRAGEAQGRGPRTARHGRRRRARLSRRLGASSRGVSAVERLGDGGDVLGRVAAAAAGDVDEPAVARTRRGSGPCPPARDRSRSATAGWAGRRSGSTRWPRSTSPRARRGTGTSGRGRASS